MTTKVNENQTAQNEEAVSANSEKQTLQGLIESDTTSIKDFSDFAQAHSEYLDEKYVSFLEDLADRIAKRIAPKNQDNALEEITKQLLSAKTVEDRLKYTLQIQDEVNKSGKQFEEVLAVTNQLSDEDFYNAHAERIMKLVDSEFVATIKRSPRAVLKYKRADKPTDSTGTTKTKAAKEVVSFIFNNTEYKNISTGTRASMSAEVAKISEATGLKTKKDLFDAIKDPAKAKKLGFTNVKVEVLQPE